jgi:hypothetical protein
MTTPAYFEIFIVPLDVDMVSLRAKRESHARREKQLMARRVEEVRYREAWEAKEEAVTGALMDRIQALEDALYVARRPPSEVKERYSVQDVYDNVSLPLRRPPQADIEPVPPLRDTRYAQMELDPVLPNGRQLRDPSPARSLNRGST